MENETQRNIFWVKTPWVKSICKKSFWVKGLWVKSMCKKSFWVEMEENGRNWKTNERKCTKNGRKPEGKEKETED